jgi:hypothetical protein
MRSASQSPRAHRVVEKSRQEKCDTMSTEKCDTHRSKAHCTHRVVHRHPANESSARDSDRQLAPERSAECTRPSFIDVQAARDSDRQVAPERSADRKRHGSIENARESAIGEQNQGTVPSYRVSRCARSNTTQACGRSGDAVLPDGFQLSTSRGGGAERRPVCGAHRRREAVGTFARA